MRELWRATGLLLQTAWQTNPRYSMGLLLEPVGFVRVPLFAYGLKLMTDGALQQDSGQLVIGAAGIVATRALWFVGMWTGSRIRTRLVEEVGFAFERKLAMLMSELHGLEHYERPDLLDRLELLRQHQGTLSGALNTLIYTANTIVAGVGTLLALILASPWVLLVVPFTLPTVPIATIQQRLLRQIETRSAPTVRLARHLMHLAVDRHAGMEMRVFGLGDEIMTRFRLATVEVRTLKLTMARRMLVLNSMADLIFLMGLAATVAVTLWLATSGRVTVGVVVMVIYLAQQLRTSIADPIQRTVGLGEVLRAASRMLWLEDYAARMRRNAKGSKVAPSNLGDGIVLDRLSFRYHGVDKWVFRNISVRIPAGAVVALVGENGTGKTTLVKLLCRMYEPTEGRILVDGVDLAEIEVNSWRSRLSAAFQDFARFEFTAQNTVGVGDLAHLNDYAAMCVALDRAAAADVLVDLPDGAKTQLGTRWEKGIDLSVGQWQKLALGRALMRRSPLMVFFDEPTASLDALAENALFERYAYEAGCGSARGTITVLVSHRFSTVRCADLILVFDSHGLRELGNHTELLQHKGLYAHLYQLQARAYV